MRSSSSKYSGRPRPRFSGGWPTRKFKFWRFLIAYASFGSHGLINGLWLRQIHSRHPPMGRNPFFPPQINPICSFVVAVIPTRGTVSLPNWPRRCLMFHYLPECAGNIFGSSCAIDGRHPQSPTDLHETWTCRAGPPPKKVLAGRTHANGGSVFGKKCPISDLPQRA